MGKKRGRPPSEAGKAKDESIEVRVSGAEKEAFQAAADLSGLAVSAWVRERLRKAAAGELRKAGLGVAFLPDPEKPPTMP